MPAMLSCGTSASTRSTRMKRIPLLSAHVLGERRRAGLAETRVALAVENVVGAGGNVAAVGGGHAHAALAYALGVEVGLVHVGMDVDGFRRALGEDLLLRVPQASRGKNLLQQAI